MLDLTDIRRRSKRWRTKHRASLGLLVDIIAAIAVGVLLWGMR